VYDFDVEGRRVLARRVGGGTMEFGYDDLIVPGGVQQSYFGHPEFACGTVETLSPRGRSER